MKRVILTFLILLSLCGCSRKYIPVETEVIVKETVRDTVVMTKTEKEYVKETIQDTTSTVETKYAKSTAVWRGDSGTLEHTIENKQDSIPVRIQYKDRETIIEKPVPYPVEVEKIVDKPVRMPLRWWERILQYVGAATLCGGVLYITFRFKRA